MTEGTPETLDTRRTEMSIKGLRGNATALAAIAGALVVTATSLAALTAKNPATMILRQTDIGKVEAYEVDDRVEHYIRDPLDAAAVDYEESTYTGLGYSETRGALQVSGWVIATPNAAQARKAFTAAQKGLESWRRMIGTPRLTPLSLPSYGNQQKAGLDEIDPGTGIGYGTLLVRKNSVVWFLHVAHERRPPRSRAELIADLRRFASKQARRVGAGS